MVLLCIENIKDGLYFNNNKSLGDMVFWNNQKILVRGEPMKATRVTRIAFGETKDKPGITIVNHIMESVETNTGLVNAIKQD